MTFPEWSKSSVDYGRKLVDSAVEGARVGEDEFLELQEEALASYLSQSARRAVPPAVMGACLGVLGGCLDRRRSIAAVVVCGLFGGAIGFAAGVIWDSRQLTARVASGAWKNVRKTRNEHEAEKNLIVCK